MEAGSRNDLGYISIAIGMKNGKGSTSSITGNYQRNMEIEQGRGDSGQPEGSTITETRVQVLAYQAGSGPSRTSRRGAECGEKWEAEIQEEIDEVAGAIWANEMEVDHSSVPVDAYRLPIMGYAPPLMEDYAYAREEVGSSFHDPDVVLSSFMHVDIKEVKKEVK